MLSYRVNLTALNIITLFNDVGWVEAAAAEKFADCVIISTQDQLHKVCNV